jgi:hypothetical protein
MESGLQEASMKLLLRWTAVGNWDRATIPEEEGREQR